MSVLLTRDRTEVKIINETDEKDKPVFILKIQNTQYKSPHRSFMKTKDMVQQSFLADLLKVLGI